ncbi:MAG TPA: hypothetical protein VKB95_01820 [Chitinophagaceae bacterium]|nr:hypothetical protein [Chitinophagaceae bacterium]
MKTTTFKSNTLTIIAALLAFPTVYFIIANLLNGIGIPGPYNLIGSFVENSRGREPLGWNINLLILCGPIAAILLTFFQFVKIEFHSTNEEFLLHFSIQKRWFPILVTAVSLAVLASIFFYLLGENCNC